MKNSSCQWEEKWVELRRLNLLAPPITPKNIWQPIRRQEPVASQLSAGLKNNFNLFESSCDQIKHHVTESCKLTSGLFSHWSTDLSVKPLASQWRHCRDPATSLLTAWWTVAWWEWSAAVMSLTLSQLIGGFWSWRFWLEVMWPRCFHWPARYVQTTWFMFSFYTWSYYCVCPLGGGRGLCQPITIKMSRPAQWGVLL